MRGRAIRLSPVRVITCDFLRYAKEIPSVPVQRRMNLRKTVAAREANLFRPSWAALFTKAYALTAAEFPELRRAYVKFPWPHLYEFPRSVANITVEREYQGEKGIFMLRLDNPEKMDLHEIHRVLRSAKELPVDHIPEFRRVLLFSRIPWPIRPMLWWLGLNVGRGRGKFFGTFTLSVYSSLGAESLHPLTPSTTALNYGIIEPDGTVNVRIVYDHRVMDGATVARALERLESILCGEIVRELAAGTPSRKALELQSA